MISPLVGRDAWEGFAAPARAGMLAAGLSAEIADEILAGVRPRWEAILVAGFGTPGPAKWPAALAAASTQLLVVQTELALARRQLGLVLAGAATRPAAAADPGADPGGDRPPAA